MPLIDGVRERCESSRVTVDVSIRFVYVARQCADVSECMTGSFAHSFILAHRQGAQTTGCYHRYIQNDPSNVKLKRSTCIRHVRSSVGNDHLSLGEMAKIDRLSHIESAHAGAIVHRTDRMFENFTQTLPILPACYSVKRMLIVIRNADWKLFVYRRIQLVRTMLFLLVHLNPATNVYDYRKRRSVLSESDHVADTEMRNHPPSVRLVSKQKQQRNQLSALVQTWRACLNEIDCVTSVLESSAVRTEDEASSKRSLTAVRCVGVSK
ncbi:hypothetical protein CBL_07962 [Carabus blaptoides fortunei]